MGQQKHLWQVLGTPLNPNPSVPSYKKAQSLIPQTHHQRLFEVMICRISGLMLIQQMICCRIDVQLCLRKQITAIINYFIGIMRDQQRAQIYTNGLYELLYIFWSILKTLLFPSSLATYFIKQIVQLITFTTIMVLTLEMPSLPQKLPSKKSILLHLPILFLAPIVLYSCFKFLPVPLTVIEAAVALAYLGQSTTGFKRRYEEISGCLLAVLVVCRCGDISIIKAAFLILICCLAKIKETGAWAKIMVALHFTYLFLDGNYSLFCCYIGGIGTVYILYRVDIKLSKYKILYHQNQSQNFITSSYDGCQNEGSQRSEARYGQVDYRSIWDIYLPIEEYH